MAHSSSHAEVTSAALEQLQQDLIALSQNLRDLHDTLQSNISRLGDEWQDDKYDEFVDEFHSCRDMILDLSEKYAEWAKNFLTPRIEIVKQAENIPLGI